MRVQLGRNEHTPLTHTYKQTHTDTRGVSIHRRRMAMDCNPNDCYCYWGYIGVSTTTCRALQVQLMKNTFRAIIVFVSRMHER